MPQTFYRYTVNDTDVDATDDGETVTVVFVRRSTGAFVSEFRTRSADERRDVLARIARHLDTANTGRTES